MEYVKETRNLEERGLQGNSYFHVVFADGSERTEHDLNWSTIAKAKKVMNGDKLITVMTTGSVKKITINHGALKHDLVVPEGYEVYQHVISQTRFMSNGMKRNSTLGRVVGLIKGGIITEEYLLNGMENIVIGKKYE